MLGTNRIKEVTEISVPDRQTTTWTFTPVAPQTAALEITADYRASLLRIRVRDAAHGDAVFSAADIPFLRECFKAADALITGSGG